MCEESWVTACNNHHWMNSMGFSEISVCFLGRALLGETRIEALLHPAAELESKIGKCAHDGKHSLTWLVYIDLLCRERENKFHQDCGYSKSWAALEQKFHQITKQRLFKWYFRENRMWNSLQLAVLANGGSGQQKRITSSQDITWPFVLVHVSFEIYILYKHCPAKWVYRTRGFLKMGKVLQAWVLFFPPRQTWIKSLLLNHIEEHSWTETVQTWAPVKSLSSMSQT